MNFNSEFFEQQKNIDLDLEINGLIKRQYQLLDFLKDFLKATNDQIQIENCDCFVELAIKIRLNLESANNLLPKLHEDYRFKTSLNLIYRCIVDDLINTFYLSGFVLINEISQVSLDNELNILHKEFLIGTIEGIDAENEHMIYVQELLKNVPLEKQDIMSGLIRDNPQLIENAVLKNNKKLRQTSHIKLQERTKDTNGANFISEKKKIDFIKFNDPMLAASLLGTFKYLSQYQHYSPKMHQFVLSDAELDVEIYNKTLIQILQMLDLQLKFIKVNDIEKIKSRFDNLIKQFSNLN